MAVTWIDGLRYYDIISLPFNFYPVNIFSVNHKDMDSHGNLCALCENMFERMNKGFKMWRISKVIKATTFEDLFHKHGYAEVENQFLCEDCLKFANIRTMGVS